MDAGIPPRLLMMILAGLCESPPCDLPTTTQESGDKRESRFAQYELIPGVGYYKFHSNATWEEAQNICAQDDSQLAVINSEKEYNALREQLSLHPDEKKAFLGFHDKFEDGVYVTITGIPLEYTGFVRWSSSYTTEGSQLNCGALDQSGGLSTAACTDTLPFFCEKELWYEYELVPGIGYYKLHTTKQTWIEAYKTCVAEGAHLAIINSEPELHFMRKSLEKQPLPKAHIGFHEIYNTGKYVTVLGGSIARQNYVHWDPQEPLSSGITRCGSFTSYGTLRVGSCVVKDAFFCEHPL